MKRVALDGLAGGGPEAREIARALRAGAVLAIPTESSYGLAVDPRSESGVRRIRQIKGREAGKALLVLAADRAQLEGLGIAATKEALEHYLALWPAALTVILPLASPLPASCGAPTIAVRIPAHAQLRSLLEETGPMTATSLNRSGQEPCVDPDDAERLFGDELDVLVDGGITAGGPPSTLLDATVDPPRVLRAGAFPWPPASR